MNIELTLNEARVVGSLMEKSVLTPDQYPLTLNALTNACNQKTSRDPVLSLDSGTVQHTARQLEGKHLLSSKDNFKGRAERYTQRFCNTPFSELKFSEPEFAVICVLLLRGPATPGEIRTRTASLHRFADNPAVVATLKGLMEREGRPLVARLPRKPGRQDSEYCHLFSGHVESAPEESPPATPVGGATTAASNRADRLAEVEVRLERVEQELAELKRLLHPASNV